MDELDRNILELLSANARMTVKEIAQRVSLTSPAVAQRIQKMEKRGVIAGYTVRLAPEQVQHSVHAIISIYVPPADRDAFHSFLERERDVEQCYQVTGQQSHMVKVCCRDIATLEGLISRLQKLGPTSTQIVLATLRGPSTIPVF